MGVVDFGNAPRSAYLHIPFCHRRCFYCDFAVVPLGDKASGLEGPGSLSIKAYLDLLHREIALVCGAAPLSTVYLGGGTPSLLTPNQIKDLLNHLRNQVGFQDGAEITLEMDPASFNKNDLEGYVEAGVNRVSLGIQSFNDRFLEILGRRHRIEDILQACNWIDEFYKSGRLSSWNLDLIQSLPRQNLLDWETELREALSVGAPHFSIYELSIEPGTVFERRERKGEVLLPNEEIALEMMTFTSSTLSGFGFSRYEISNYAVPGHVSRHNRVYWSGSGWWGFGQGATSAPWGERFSRPRTRNGYRAWIESQEEEGLHKSLIAGCASRMPLDEKLMVGLRRREGVDLMHLFQQWGWSRDQSEEYFNSLERRWGRAMLEGWLSRRGWRFQLSDPYGMAISNQVLAEIFVWWDSLPEDAVVVSIP